MTFIPYGCQVDHFQESVYLHPEWTPAQRNEEWNRLEKLYRPHLDNREVNFYNRGAGWQRQLHIYECPFYYIDYSLAQMISLQFWSLSMHDHKAAWEKYLAFAKLGGTQTFVDIVHHSGLACPIEDGGSDRNGCRRAQLAGHPPAVKSIISPKGGSADGKTGKDPLAGF